jgi:hypothetical protein
MKIIVGFEESQVITEELRKRGHEAYSCDLYHLGAINPDWHLQMDIFDALALGGWQGGIFHPPCTHIAVCGNRWYAGTRERQEAIELVERVWDYPLEIMGLENPMGVLSTQSKLGKPTQYIHPWQFGHGETKKTCLWLRGLPLLKPTNIVDGREQRVWKMPPGPERQKLRSRTYRGWAVAMAEQWFGCVN